MQRKSILKIPKENIFRHLGAQRAQNGCPKGKTKGHKSAECKRKTKAFKGREAWAGLVSPAGCCCCCRLKLTLLDAYAERERKSGGGQRDSSPKWARAPFKLAPSFNYSIIFIKFLCSLSSQSQEGRRQEGEEQGVWAKGGTLIMCVTHSRRSGRGRGCG